MNRIFVTRNLPGDYLRNLASRNAVRVHDAKEPISHDALVEEASVNDAMIVLLSDRIDEEVLSKGLKCVANYAVGYDNIDLEAARRYGVAICNTPDVLTDATADLAFGLLLSAARRIPESEIFLRDGLFSGWEPSLFTGMPVAGSVLGVVGAGRIGKAVMARALGFGMKILYCDNDGDINEEIATAYGAEHTDLESLLENSDFVSLHVPLTEQTHHLLNADKLGLMKSTAVLVNTSRGQVIDEDALAEALESRRIFSAGLDVFEKEPKIHPRLMKLNNVVMTPHTGSATVRARNEMARLCCDAVESVLTGKIPPNTVIPPP